MKKNIMKKLFAALLTLVCVFSLISVNASASASAQDTAKAQIEAAAEAYLSAAAKNMWLYESNDLSAGTIAELAATPLVMSDVAVSAGLQSMEINAYIEDITFAQEKAKYFRDMRLEQNIKRNDFEVHYLFAPPTITENRATVSAIEFIAFQYPDYPEELSEVVNYYEIELIKFNHEWFVAGVTAENDDFDDVYKGTGFTAERAEEFFAAQEAKSAAEDMAVEKLMEQYGFAEETSEDIETQTLAATNVYYDYNPDNATAYAYTYVSQMFGTTDWNNVSDADKAIGRTFYNENFREFSSEGGDCQNFASQCIWAGFNGSNSPDQIYNANTGTYSPIMDTGGSYVWRGTIPGKSVNSYSWTGCNSFRTYIDNEVNSGDPDMIVKKGTISAKQNFSSIYTELKGALLHVNSGGHAIIVTDVTGPERTQTYFCAHTSDRKAVKVADFWPDLSIYYFIPQQMKIRNAPEVKISANLMRPVASGTSTTVGATTNVSCVNLIVTVKRPDGISAYNSVSNSRAVNQTATFSQKGLYTITITANKASGSSLVTYVYTVRVY